MLQFDQKETIYNLPAALEVGQLFGDPPMMFFDGKINEEDNFVSDNNAFSITTGGLIGQIPVGTEVILGLRPTDVILDEAGKGQVQGEVYSVQYMFDHQLITIKVKDYLFDVISPINNAISEGDKAAISIPTDVLYFFDKATHKVIRSEMP